MMDDWIAHKGMGFNFYLILFYIYCNSQTYNMHKHDKYSCAIYENR